MSVLAIVGPTASGKSAAAMALARASGGALEVVVADSMTVYRGMDIGTATPTPAEQASVRHHLVDVVDPADEFSVAAFQALGRAALADIASRGRHAVVVGGTGLYVRALVDDLELPGRWPEQQAALDAEVDAAADPSVALRGLHARLAQLDPVAAGRIEITNRRRIVRALEVTIGAGRPFSSFGPGMEAYPAVPIAQLGLRIPLDQLDRRIEARFSAMIDEGLLDEVRGLAHAERPLSSTAAHALGYRELLAHLRGECSLEAAVERAVARTRTFARRQIRWFRRDPRIRWVDVGTGPAGVDTQNVVAEAEALLGDYAPCI